MRNAAIAGGSLYFNSFLGRAQEKNIEIFLKNHGGSVFGGAQNPDRNTAVFYFREECRKINPAAPDFYKQAGEAARPFAIGVRPSARLFVMAAALEDHELCFSQLVDEPVLFVYAAAPQAGEFVFQRLRPADPVVAVTLYVFYELGLSA